MSPEMERPAAQNREVQAAGLSPRTGAKEEAQPCPQGSGIEGLSQEIIDRYAGIPMEMRQYPQWCVWRLEYRVGQSKPAKVPYNPITGMRVDVTNLAHLCMFDVAFGNVSNWNGIGFVFGANDPFTGIDLDDTQGDVEAFERQQKIYREFNSYSELSPSGKGLHIIVKGTVPTGRRKANVEVYSDGRFFTMTGNAVNNVGIAERQPLLDILYDQMGGAKATFEANQFFKPATEADEVILQRASSASNGDKFQRLWNGDWQGFGYPGQSEADFALINMLAFYTSDPEQITRLFRASVLGQRDKAKRANYVGGMVNKAFDRHYAGVNHPFTVNGQAFGASPAPAPVMPTVFDVGDWDGLYPPVRKFVASGWIAAGQVTYLTGKGASGKSLLCQLLATCTALGLPFIGQQTARGVSLYVTCEDDPSELQRRQIAICVALGATLKALRRQMAVASLVGGIGNELATFDRMGSLHPAPAYQWLESQIKAIGATLVVLDNVAHLFTGDENNRHQVAAFVGLLNALAIETGAAIVLIGHPNKAGVDYSGSTAWENQVRTRLFLEIPKVGEIIPDMDARVLVRSKANYGRAGDFIKFRWHKGSFIAEDDLPADVNAAIAANNKALAENAAFLECLAKATADKRAVSHVNGSNYAPRVFAKMVEAKGTMPAAFERAMERLLHIGAIRLNEPLWKGDNRHWKHGIALAPESALTPAPTPCADPRQPPGQVIENTAPSLRAPTPLYLTDILGGASEGPPPDNEEGAPMA